MTDQRLSEWGRAMRARMQAGGSSKATPPVYCAPPKPAPARKGALKVVQPLSMRALVVVAMLAMAVQSFTLVYVVLHSQRDVNITVMGGK